MLELQSDTIFAVCTGPVNAAVGMIRLSGPQSKEIAESLFYSRQNNPICLLKSRYLYFGRLVSSEKEIIDEVLMVFMPGPHSFTGEDVVEIQCHGNQILISQICATLQVCSRVFAIRPAEPGEFSKRAYLNGRLNLTEAEALHDLIAAESEAMYKASLANMTGRLGNEIKQMRSDLIEAMALVEAGFEFPEEDIQTFDPQAVAALALRIYRRLLILRDSFRTSQFIESGVRVALIGPPNAGKSSLLNALMKEDRAIVHERAGTTRDTILGQIHIHGIPFILIDTAGLRETSDEIEAEGIRRSRLEIEKADVIISLFDAITRNQERLPADVLKKPILSVANKSDLLTELEATSLKKNLNFDLMISSKLGSSLVELEKLLFQKVFDHNSVQNNVLINSRQRELIKQCLINFENILSDHFRLHIRDESDLFLDSVQIFSEQFNMDEELLADDLRNMAHLFDQITGGIDSEDVLSDIFSRFCIGK